MHEGQAGFSVNRSCTDNVFTLVQGRLREYIYISQRGDSPFVYRDRGGWPAPLPYICKIRVSVGIGTQSGIRLHERVPMVKIWGSSKNHQNQTIGKALKFYKFIFTILHFLLLVVVVVTF